MRENNKFFPIIMWFEANPGLMSYDQKTAGDFYNQSFSRIASLKCNTVRPSNLPLDYAHILLKSAKDNNLKVILDPQWGNQIINVKKMTAAKIKEQWELLKASIKQDVIVPFAGYENLLGYAVSDEPKPDKLEQWKLIVKMFYELDPIHPDFTVFNLPTILKAAAEHEETILGNIVYDNYPHEIFTPLNTMGPPFKPDPCYEFEWYTRYKGFYEASNLRPSVPQISTVAVFYNDNPWRFPTPTEFRTTVYTSLVEGAKGIMFFAYMDVPGEEKLKCLVDRNWSPHDYPTSGPVNYPSYPPLCECVEEITGELEKLAPFISGLQRIGEVTGWETTDKVLSCNYKSQYAEYLIIANKDPDPDHTAVSWHGQLANEYFYQDIISGDTFRPGTDGNVTVLLKSAQGRILKKRVYQGDPLFGSFDSPADNIQNTAGAVPLTGWALGLSPVNRIEIKRSAVAGDHQRSIDEEGLVYIGDAVIIEGARPDISELYHEYPGCEKAGWGYMLLTNCLPNQGNGVFTFHAFAYDDKGIKKKLGQKLITCNNAASNKPFGNIDTPGQGATIFGSTYRNYGWVLTPLPNTIPKDGLTITVYVDGKPVGHPKYNFHRQDIEDLFPGLNNSKNAVGYYVLDTTQYENGIHTISWLVKDNNNNETGIGSRYFFIKNPTS